MFILNAGVNLNTASSPLQLNGAAGNTGQFLTSAGAGSSAPPEFVPPFCIGNIPATSAVARSIAFVIQPGPTN